MRFDLSRLTIEEWYRLLSAIQVGGRPASEWPEVNHEFEKAIMEQLRRHTEYGVKIVEPMREIMDLYQGLRGKTQGKVVAGPSREQMSDRIGRYKQCDLI